MLGARRFRDFVDGLLDDFVWKSDPQPRPKNLSDKTATTMVAGCIARRIKNDQEFTLKGLEGETGVPLHHIRRIVDGLINQGTGLNKLGDGRFICRSETHDHLMTIAEPLDEESQRQTEMEMEMEKSVMTTRVFISHASGDGHIVNHFVRLLESGVGIPARDIFCSSTPGQGIRPGEDFVQSIKNHVTGGSVTLAFLTPAFRDRPFCWGELGAAWALSKTLIPLLAPFMAWSHLEDTVLKGIHGVVLSEPNGLDALRDELILALGLENTSTPRWSREKDTFMREINKWKAPENKNLEARGQSIDADIQRVLDDEE